jgi:arginine decarboxylase
MGLADLCQFVHELYAKYDIARLTTEMYLSDLAPAMKPSDAYAHIARRKTERVEIDQLEGRITVGLVTPYPPGIPLLIPGEVFNKQDRRLPEVLARVQRAVPGLRNRHPRPGDRGRRPDGVLRYYADCVKN